MTEAAPRPGPPRSFCHWLLGACAVVAAAPSHAQQAVEGIPVQTLPQAEAEAPPSSGKEAAAVQLEAVVVTGDNLKREAKRSAAAATVITGAAIERGTDASVYQVMQGTPNLSVQEGRFGFNSFSIRGMNSTGPEVVASSAQFGTTTAIVVDGVALPRFALAVSDLSAHDLAQVELLRGPQSTSIGRNALAGAVVVSTREPIDGWQAKVRGVGSERAAGQLALTGNAPLGLDGLKARGSFDLRDNPGDLANITRREHDYARDDNRTLRGKIGYSRGGPYAANLGYTRGHRLLGSRYVEQANEARHAATSNDETYSDSRNQLLSLQQSLAFGPRWQLGGITAGFDTGTRLVADYDYTANPGAFYDSLQTARAVSQELRLGYEGERLRAVLGAYGYDSEEDEVADLLVDLPTFARVLNLCRTGVECLALQGQSINAHTGYPTQNRNLALFGELDFKLVERLTLTAGLRYDRERVQRTNIFRTTPSGAGAAAFLAALRAARVFGPDGEFPIDESFSALLPKAALVYELHPDWFANASYRRGYRAGGAARNVVGGFDYEFDPEFTDSYEVGIKATPWRRVNVALNVFRTGWTDMQVATGTGTTARVENAGRSRIDGIELETRARLLPTLGATLELGLLEARFVRFQSGASGDLGGKRLPYAPCHTGSIGLDYKPFRGAFIRPEVQFQGGGFGGPENSAAQKLDARGLVNLKLGWAAGDATLYFIGTNLADDNYRTDAYFNTLGNASIASLGVGRMLGAGMDYQF